jgi:CRISPR-associated protein Cmr6
MTLHPLYGLPIIPGSALKGLTRAWVETEKNETTQVPVPGGKSISLVERIFGNQREEEIQHGGSVIFFDAILMDENFRLTLDIMNPHYPRYYQKEEPPSNDQNPIPVPFLTVGGRATFLFAIAPRNPLNEEQKSDAQAALQWLHQALAEYGIGSKTSSGYGYMEEKQQYKRPERLSDFKVGDPITGKCMYKNTVSIKVRTPLAAPQVLQYSDFKLDEVLIAVIDDDKVTTHWQPNTEHTCSFLYEQIRDNCTVLVCKPRETSATPTTSGKKKNKKAKDKNR